MMMVAALSCVGDCKREKNCRRDGSKTDEHAVDE